MRCSESSFTYPAALLRSSLSSLFWFSGFLRPQNWTLEIWTVLRLMCNEVVSKVNGGGSQGDLTGLQSQGNPQPMHLPRLQRDQPHWRQYTLDSQKTISKLWTLRHLLSAFWTSARIQKNIPLALLFCGSKKLPGGFFSWLVGMTITGVVRSSSTTVLTHKIDQTHSICFYCCCIPKSGCLRLIDVQMDQQCSTLL